MRERLRDLEGTHDPAPRAHMGGHADQVPALEANRSAVGRNRAGDQVEDRALARAVGPDHAQTVPRLEREGHVVGDDDRTESLPQARYLEECRHLYLPPPERLAGAVAIGSAELREELQLRFDRNLRRRGVVDDQQLEREAAVLRLAPLAT